MDNRKFLYYIGLFIAGGMMAVFSNDFFVIGLGALLVSISFKKCFSKKKSEVGKFILLLVLSLIVCAGAYIFMNLLKESLYGGVYMI